MFNFRPTENSSRGRDIWREVPGILGDIHVSRDGVAQGGREDLKDLFDAGCGFRIFKTHEDLQAYSWRASLYFDHEDEDWSRMERVLDMSEQEFGEEIERDNVEM